MKLTSVIPDEMCYLIERRLSRTNKNTLPANRIKMLYNLLKKINDAIAILEDWRNTIQFRLERQPNIITQMHDECDQSTKDNTN